ncbi:hypothetical protein DM01DRAFT_1291723, partial [Hesseltinella vesiculosa]
DFIMFAKSTTLPIRCVVLDYAGLSTCPGDIVTFAKELKSIKEVVVDHGDSLEKFTRHQLINGNIQKFHHIRLQSLSPL